uniref:ATP-dependent Clp protease proteolytic subunit n=1 Tax=Elaeis guineensis var. tenera TaxID=51953 RepID=A0A6I9QLF5_ELAGV|nr:ATP-dependent Clp protease proteolytic subunit 6, chloroplastic [Elaeis guineensis]
MVTCLIIMSIFQCWVAEVKQMKMRYDAAIEAKKGNPPIMPAVMTPGGPLDLSSVLFRNRIIFIGQPVNSQVAQRVISQLLTLASIDDDADILVYLNCPGGSTYSVLAICDCMSRVIT